MTAGKCETCQVSFFWNGSPRLREAKCPLHGTQLMRTIYSAKRPTVWLDKGFEPTPGVNWNADGLSHINQLVEKARAIYAPQEQAQREGRDIDFGDEVSVLGKDGNVALIGEVLCITHPVGDEPQVWVWPKTTAPKIVHGLGDPGEGMSWTWHGPLSVVRLLLKSVDK